jgi:hypothetical protein
MAEVLSDIQPLRVGTSKFLFLFMIWLMCNIGMSLAVRYDIAMQERVSNDDNVIISHELATFSI